MVTYAVVARLLARLEERVARLEPEPPVVLWLRTPTEDTVTNARTGEVLRGAEFDRRYPGVIGFTLNLHHAGADWEPPAWWGAEDAPPPDWEPGDTP